MRRRRAESSFGAGSVEGEVAALRFENIGDQTEGFSGQLTVADSSTGDDVALQVAFVAIRTGDLVTGLTRVSAWARSSTPPPSTTSGSASWSSRPARWRVLVVVGGGRMGEALVAGLLSAGWAAADLTVVEVSAERRAALGDLVPGVDVHEASPRRRPGPTARSWR